MREELRQLLIDREATIASAVENSQTVEIQITYADGRVDHLREFVQQGQRVIVCIGRVQ